MRAPSRVALIALAALALDACSRPAALGWSASSAAAYLDRRAENWVDWHGAARSQGTVCISCHTALPYLLASDALEAHDPHRALPAPQRKLLDSVLKRVRLGTNITPYYPHQAVASRATEAVLNALILSDRDAGSGHLSVPTEKALGQMWALQITSGSAAGSWPWIQFDNEPWEGDQSEYLGAVLGALAVERAPPAYRNRPELQPALQRLREYLTSAYPGEPLLNRIHLLWAAARWPALMTPSTQEDLLAEIWAHQHADGGWNTASLLPKWRRRDGTPEPSGSDGYATGLITLTLELSGVPSSDPRLQRSRHWLETHQSWLGYWSASSLNRRFRHRDGLKRGFMNDAATAYALLALLPRDDSGHPAAAQAGAARAGILR